MPARRAYLTTIIGLSGTALILSLTLLDKIAPQKTSIWLVIVAWGLLTLTIITAIIILLIGFNKDVVHQKEFESYNSNKGRLRKTPLSPIEVISTPSARSIIGEVIAACFFIPGLIALAIFAGLNLMG